MLLLVIQWILLIVKDNEPYTHSSGRLLQKVSECVINTCVGNDITPSRVAEMCQSTKVVENNNDTNGIFLSLKEQVNNCSCTVSVKNGQGFVGVYIKRLNFLADKPLCGMDIDVYQHGPNETVLLNPIPTRCNSTKKDKGLSLLEYEQLQFVSRVVGGMFSFGYCIQIGIVHKQNVKDNIYLEIACENQTITTHTDTPTYPQTTINDVITSSQIISTLSTTMSMSDQSQIHDETDVEGDNTLYIAEGAGGGFVLCVLVVVVILLCKRRKSHHSRKKDSNANCTANSIAADDDEDDGLKYNMLYVSSERHDDIDVNYSTADGDTPRHISCEDEGCYSSVDDTKIIQNSNSYTHEVTNTAFEFSEDNSVEHKNAPIERGCVYAVVDKSHKTNSSVKNIENASSSATYAVVDKNIMRHQQEGNT